MVTAGCLLFTSCREKLSGKSKQALFWSLKSGQIGTNQLYLAVLGCQKYRSMSPPAIFQTVSEVAFSETRIPLADSGEARMVREGFIEVVA